MSSNGKGVGLLSLILLAPITYLIIPGPTSARVPPKRAEETDSVAPQASVDSGSRLPPALLRRLRNENGQAKAWVFFTDKGITLPEAYRAAIERVAATYNERATRRRMLRGERVRRGDGPFDARDLPVVQDYVDAVSATGARVQVTSRWLNAVSVRGTREQLERIAELACVRALQPVARFRLSDVMDVRELNRAAAGGRDGDRLRGGVDYGLSEAQLAQINVIALHEAGFTGAGVIVGILDTGFRRSHVAFNHPDHPLEVAAEWDFVNNDGDTDIEPGDPANQHEHGTYILGVLGAYNPGTLVGGVYDASFILAKVEDVEAEYPLEEDWFAAGLEFIEANGGDVATSSVVAFWYQQDELDGETSVMSIAWNVATENGLHGCQGAGNSGHDNDPATSHLVAPADAFEVITCGAVDSTGTIASFSSDGPTADQRNKPEVLARGVNTYTVSPSSDTGYSTPSGTSLSTPLVACAAACLVQANSGWTVEEMREHLFLSADYYLAHGTYDPLYVHGYGIVNAYEATQDCNENGIPDVADIADGTSQDANNNDIPDECECVGDINGDGVTDQADLGVLLMSYGVDDGGDVDGDGDTDQSDLGILLADWGCGLGP